MRIISASTILLLTLTLTSSAQHHEVSHTTASATLESPQRGAAALHGGPRLDTLFAHMLRSTGMLQYQYAPDPTKPNELVPVTGTNPAYHAVGELFDFSGTGKVKGLLLGIRDKAIAGAPDTLMALVIAHAEGMEMDENSKIAAGRIATSHIDTGTTRIRLTPLLFPASAPLTTDFLAVLQTRQFVPAAAEDRIGLWSNVHKDGRGENRALAMSYDMAKGEMHVVHLSQIFKVGGEPLDINLAIIPIIEVTEGTSGADLPTVGELTMSGAYPNPAMSRAVIGFTASRSGVAEIALLDASARAITTLSVDVVAGEARSVPLDLSGVGNGTYYYVVTLGATSVAGSITVVK